MFWAVPRGPGKKVAMVTFLTLWNWTEQGVTKIQDTIKRAEDFANTAEKAGARVKQFSWLVGQYDGMLILEAPDETTAVGLLAKLAKLGNIRTQTLRSFDSAEMQKILGKVK
jgi:uncharacterized protein with GYD domain